MSMAQQYASYLERESHKAATPVKAEAMRQAANKLYELDREIARLHRFEQVVDEAISVDVDVVVPIRDYSKMSPKDCYEAGMLDGGMAVREAIRAALTATMQPPSVEVSPSKKELSHEH